MARFIPRILRNNFQYSCYTSYSLFGTSASKNYAKPYPKPMLWTQEFYVELDKVMNKKSFTTKKIEKLQESYLENSGVKSVQSFDVIVMGKLKKCNQPELARFFMQYIKQHREPHTLAVVSYLHSCFSAYPNETLQEYYKLKKTLDLNTVNVSILTDLICIEARTKEWKGIYDILKLLDKEIEMGENPKILSQAVGRVIAAAIESSNFEVIFDLEYNHPRYYNTGLAKHLLMPALYEKLAKGNMPFDLFVYLFYDLGAESKMNLRECQAMEIVKTLKGKNNGLKCTLSSINKESGICQNCGHGLVRHEVTLEERLILEQSVKDSIVVGSNIYKMTTPQEFELYQEFLESSTHDVVIDGPNVYFSKDISFWTDFKKIAVQLQEFLGKKDIKVLILCDRYRFRDFYKIPLSFQSMVTLYTINFSKTHDDVFLLMAALNQGKPCYMVTNDNFRNHRGQLIEDQAKLFTHWQAAYQILHNQYELEFPSTYRCITDMNDPVWHVPYEIENIDPITKQNEVCAYFRSTSEYVCIEKEKTYRRSPEVKEYLRLKTKYKQAENQPVSKSKKRAKKAKKTKK